MGLKVINVPSIQNGVSQQADDLRRPNQVTEQINAASQLIKGLSKRPNTNHVTELDNALLVGVTKTNTATFPINLSEDKKYIAIVHASLSDASLTVVDVDGNTLPLYDTNGLSLSSLSLSYLKCTSPVADIRSMTVVDTTFLLNRTIVTEMQPDVTPSRIPEALVFVKACRARSSYTITVTKDATSYSGTFTVPDVNYDGSAESGDNYNQGDVATELADSLIATGGTYYNVTRQGELIYITRKDSTDFSISVNYSESESLYAFKEKVQNLTLLPQKGWVGFKIKVVGDVDDKASTVGYYVNYESADGVATGCADGSWVECAADGIEYIIDPDTMPHKLIPYLDGFKLTTIDWGQRGSGDEDTNEIPSFIDTTINGMLFFKDRLGFLTGEARSMSESGKYFNFFRTKNSIQLDSDPVDVAVNSARKSILYSGVQSAERLILFSEQAQFQCEDSSTLLTPQSASITQSSSYDATLVVDPIGVDNSVFFITERGSYLGINEYFADAYSGLFKAEDTTEQAKYYIEGKPRCFVGSSSFKTLLLITTDYEGLYVMNYLDKSNKRIQLSWSKYHFGDDCTVISSSIFEDKVYLLIDRDGMLCLEWMSLSTSITDDFADYLTTVDRRVDESDIEAVYNSATDQTTITIPYEPTSDEAIYVVTRSTDTYTGGKVIPIDTASANIVTVNGDYSDVPLFIGVSYTMEVELTKVYDRTSDASGTFAVIPHRKLQVLHADFGYNESSSFDIVIETGFSLPKTYTYSSNRVGQYDTIVGNPIERKSGRFRVRVGRANTEVSIFIKNSTPFPSNIGNCAFQVNTID